MATIAQIKLMNSAPDVVCDNCNVNGALNVIRSITLQFPHSPMVICYMRISQGIRQQKLQLKLKWWTLKLDQRRKRAISECL